MESEQKTLEQKREEMTRESWIKNVMRVIGYDRTTAELQYDKILQSHKVNTPSTDAPQSKPEEKFDPFLPCGPKQKKSREERLQSLSNKIKDTKSKPEEKLTAHRDLTKPPSEEKKQRILKAAEEMEIEIIADTGEFCRYCGKTDSRDCFYYSNCPILKLEKHKSDSIELVSGIAESLRLTLITLKSFLPEAWATIKEVDSALTRANKYLKNKL